MVDIDGPEAVPVLDHEKCAVCGDEATGWDYDLLNYYCDRHVQQADFTVSLTALPSRRARMDHKWDREIDANATSHELLHRLWSKAVSAPHYVKAEWKRLEALLHRQG